MLIASLLASTLNKTIPNIKNQVNDNKNNSRSILYSLYFTGMYGITINVITTFFPKYASLNSLTVVEWGSIISSLMLARLIAFILAERIRRRISVKNMFALFSFASIVFPFAATIVSSNFLILVITSALTGFSLGLVYSAALNKVMIDSFGGKGMAAGLFESSIGIGSFLGPILAGVVAMNNLWAFLLVPLATMLGGGLLGVTKRRALSINSS
jgi:MFS family permease